MTDEVLRVCAKCGEAKPLSGFYDRPGYCRACMRAYSMEWRKRFPGRRYAHTRVAAALKYGELTRPDGCEKCGKPGTVVAHHEDYRRPLAVRWLCDVCHGKRHVEIRNALKLKRRRKPKL